MDKNKRKHREIAKQQVTLREARAKEAANASFKALEPQVDAVETDLHRALQMIIETYGEDAGVGFLKFLDSAVNFPNTNFIVDDREKGALFLETMLLAMRALMFEVSTGSTQDGVKDRQIGIANNSEDFVAKIRAAVGRRSRF